MMTVGKWLHYRVRILLLFKEASQHDDPISFVRDWIRYGRLYCHGYTPIVRIHLLWLAANRGWLGWLLLYYFVGYGYIKIYSGQVMLVHDNITTLGLRWLWALLCQNQAMLAVAILAKTTFCWLLLRCSSQIMLVIAPIVTSRQVILASADLWRWGYL